jgi:hypothetical protein
MEDEKVNTLLRKKKAIYLVSVSCLGYKTLQCPGDLGKTCSDTILIIYVDVLNSDLS